MAIVAVVMIAGFSAFKMGNSNVEQFIYELDQNGTIGDRMLNPNSNCDEPFGQYCSVELSEEKPNDVVTLQDAIDEEIHIKTLYWQ